MDEARGKSSHPKIEENAQLPLPLSPATAMMVVEMYGKSKMGHGLAIWGRSRFDADATMPSRQVRTSRALMDKVADCFGHVLRAILGVRGGTGTLAVHRELGWMGLRDTVAKAKVTFASSLIALDDCRQPKAVLLHRRKSLQWLADGAALHSHKSISPRTMKSSYFVKEASDICEQIGASSILRGCLDTGKSIPVSQLLAMKHEATPTAVQETLLQLFRGRSAAVSYYEAQTWTMMPDLAQIQNADIDLRTLNVAHFRVNAHMLGSETTKRLRQDKLYE
jgi:hypothetical protein